MLLEIYIKCHDGKQSKEICSIDIFLVLMVNMPKKSFVPQIDLPFLRVVMSRGTIFWNNCLSSDFPPRLLNISAVSFQRRKHAFQCYPFLSSSSPVDSSFYILLLLWSSLHQKVSGQRGDQHFVAYKSRKFLFLKITHYNISSQL